MRPTLAASIRIDALVDTGASQLVLPTAWKERLGNLPLLERIQVETATVELADAEICGPVRLEVEGFRPVAGEVVFIDMSVAEEAQYEPLLGYLVLEAIPVAVDMLGRRLIKVPTLDLR